MQFAKLFLLASVCLISVASSAQNLAVITGPYGVPIVVHDDFGNWVAPIAVYSNSRVEVFIPDVTASSWVASHVLDFGGHDFAYQVEAYTYYYDTRRTVQELLYFDTRHPDYAVVQSFMRGRQRVAVVSGSARERATNNITALVRAEVVRARRSGKTW
jgi:hypothetical protein